MKGKQRKGEKGFTIVELIIGAMIMLMVSVAIWNIYMVSINYMTRAREVRIATDDMQDVMEKLHSVPFSGLAAYFPHDINVPEGIVGGFTLTNESIVVRYPAGTNNDPLAIEVEIDWTDINGNVQTRIFRTMRTSSI
jgi:hypothetical protein